MLILPGRKHYVSIQL